MPKSKQEIIDDLLDKKAELMKEYTQLKKSIHFSPLKNYTRMFELEEEAETLNSIYNYVMEERD